MSPMVYFSEWPPYVVVEFSDPPGFYMQPCHHADVAEYLATDDEQRADLIECAKAALSPDAYPARYSSAVISPR